MKKQNTTQFNHLFTLPKYAAVLRLFLVAVIALSGLTLKAQSTTVTGGVCSGCDASMTVKFISCNCVEVSACKDLSNVVIRTANGIEKKFDNLNIGKTGNFCSTNGSPIVKVWVKAGCFQSGDGSGYGRKFDSPVNCAAPCSDLGGDSDNDGVCNALDCQPYNPAFPAVKGTPCDDGKPETINDVVQEGGCSCAGTLQPPTPPNPVTVTGGVCTGCDASMTVKFISCTCVEVSACKDLSNVVIRMANGTDKKFDNLNIGKTGTFCATNGAVITAVWVKAGCFKSGDGPGYGRKFSSPLNCAGPCAQDGDSDNDGFCNSQDCQPNDPAFPALPGKSCDDKDPNTTNDVITADGCDCKGTPVNVCENVGLGGTIGFGPNCNGAVQYCPPNQVPPTIGNCASPIGGTGPLEIMWLKSTSSCTFPISTAAQIAAGLDSDWSVIANANELTYSPVSINGPTCFLRCVRRAGCDKFIESNIVSLGISPACGGGNVANCGNINVESGRGAITVNGLDGKYVNSVAIFNANWETAFSCFADCATPVVSVALPAGTYFVKVNVFDAKYRMVCEDNRYVNLATSLEGSLENALQFAAIKHEEHTELMWMYGGDKHIIEYVLEKSVNGVDFKPISNQPTTGNTGAQRYESYDLEPNIGDNFYRLKMVDINGTILFSEIKMVNFLDIQDFTLFPNPANGFVKLDLEKLIGQEDLTVVFFNTLGLEMKRIEISEVYSKYYQMDIRDLKEGQYFVWLYVPGKRPIASKLMVGRL